MAGVIEIEDQESRNIEGIEKDGIGHFKVFVSKNIIF
jgi:hypothetical protein